MKPKLYIAHAITGQEDLRPERLSNILSILEECGFELLLPPLAKLEHQEFSYECFEHDMKLIEEADAIVAYVGEPSTGVGLELGLHSNKLIYCWAFTTDMPFVSPFVVGFCRANAIPLFAMPTGALARQLMEDLL